MNLDNLKTPIDHEKEGAAKLAKNLSKPASEKTKTSLRHRYEAERGVIRKKLGGIEEVRSELGLSRRKMCHLLMVDPSAWSRWAKNEDRVPPHIYRSLQWYLALIEKQPEWHPQNSYGQVFVSKPQNSPTNLEISELRQQILEKNRTIENLEGTTERLEMQHRKMLGDISGQSQVQLSWKFIVILNSLVALYLIFFK